MADKTGFHADLFPGARGAFEVGSDDVAALVAVMLRRQRERHGLSLSEAARRLGSRSKTSYARYEQGRSVPTVEKLFELLAAVAPNEDFVFAGAPAARQGGLSRPLRSYDAPGIVERALLPQRAAACR